MVTHSPPSSSSSNSVCPVFCSNSFCLASFSAYFFILFSYHSFLACFRAFVRLVYRSSSTLFQSSSSFLIYFTSSPELSSLSSLLLQASYASLSRSGLNSLKPLGSRRMRWSSPLILASFTPRLITS
jgi:hypothetical protein